MTFSLEDLARLVTEHQTGVWRYLRLLGCDASLADDLTQDVFLVVLKRPFEEYSQKATASYLRTIARRLFIDAVRKRDRVVSETDLEGAEAVWIHAAADEKGDEQLNALDECLKTLTERARKALEMQYGNNASRGNVAAALELTEDGAKNLVQRAKQTLRECIRRRLEP